MLEKLLQRWELKASRTGASPRRSQLTRTTRLGLPGLSRGFPCHRNQLTTRWWSVDSSAPLFTRVSKTHGQRSDDTITKSIIDLWPRVLWYHVHLWASLCLNMVFIIDRLWLAQKSNNRTPKTTSDRGGHSSQSRPSRYCRHCRCAHWSPPVRPWSPTLGPLAEGCILRTAVQCICTNNSHTFSPSPEAWGGDPLVHQGKLQHGGAPGLALDVGPSLPTGRVSCLTPLFFMGYFEPYLVWPLTWDQYASGDPTGSTWLQTT